jgi:hypothetical protein
MHFRHRSPNSPTHRLDIQPQTPLRMRARVLILLAATRRVVSAFHLGCEYQTLVVGNIDRKRCATT